MKLFRFCSALGLLVAFYACNLNSSAAPIKHLKKKEYALAIVGYNYTTRYIDQFSVNGAGGGNIYPSSASSGGGGNVCCASFFPDVPQLKTTVRWQSDACRYISFISKNGEKTWSHHLFFKEREVKPVVLADGEAAFMEIHIYDDDHVAAFVTNVMSYPRLRLNEERADQSEYPKCPHDKKPEK